MKLLLASSAMALILACAGVRTCWAACGNRDEKSDCAVVETEITNPTHALNEPMKSDKSCATNLFIANKKVQRAGCVCAQTIKCMEGYVNMQLDYKKRLQKLTNEDNRMANAEGRDPIGLSAIKGTAILQRKIDLIVKQKMTCEGYFSNADVFLNDAQEELDVSIQGIAKLPTNNNEAEPDGERISIPELQKNAHKIQGEITDLRKKIKLDRTSFGKNQFTP